MSDISKMELIL